MKEKIITLDNNKLNKAIEKEHPAEDTREEIEEITENKEPTLEYQEDGKIKVELYAIGKDDRGNYIVEDTFFDENYKELPEGTYNESKTHRAYNKGKIKVLSAADREIQVKGGKTLQATLRQRRTFAEAISTVLAQKPSQRVREELELDSTADNLDAVIAAMLRQAQKGNVKAGDFLRDTIGEKPTDKLEASVETMTAEDREMLENIQNRMKNEQE